MDNGWAERARRALAELRRKEGGWGYRAGTAPAAEPTAMALLALRASGGADPAAEGAAGAFLGSLQREDGSVDVREGLEGPGWGTPYAILAWSGRDGREPQLKRAVAWLAEAQGELIPPGEGVPLGHDGMIPGWPWVLGTHSWLEPTAAATWALRRRGLADHPRVLDGLRLIRDRAIPTGGWNYGNSTAFGATLRPQPDPTGRALVALSGTSTPAEIVEEAAKYLEGALPATRAASALGWGLLGLSAWGRRPAEADAWLAGTATGLLGRPEAADPWRLAHLLLAAHPDPALQALGVADGGSPR